MISSDLDVLHVFDGPLSRSHTLLGLSSTRSERRRRTQLRGFAFDMAGTLPQFLMSENLTTQLWLACAARGGRRADVHLQARSMHFHYIPPRGTRLLASQRTLLSIWT